MYSKFTNDELIEAYSTMIDYSGKADDTILREIEQRGGLDKFLQEIEQKNLNKSESNRVLNELIQLTKEGYSLKRHQNKNSLRNLDRTAFVCIYREQILQASVIHSGQIN